MEDAYREKLKDLAIAIAKYQDLDESERQWLKPMLSKGIQNTLEMLDLIADRPMTFEEIAIELDISISTVTQKLNALLDGGYPLTLTDKTAFAETGRPRKLARKSDLKKKLTKLLEELE
ncbi:ArsR family transcriptional regulator [Aerosakkonema sp. BLCC-F183]|uniref:ArsR family transcriptional regulator n=1 Tax=Aerosakkonema sp. BLCC-F183 TaxID=3342834 RepID=UPI0035B9971B